MKPHEETLRVVQATRRGGRNIVASDGVVAMVRGKGGPEWAALFAAAPDMARALAGELDPDGHVIACGNGGATPEDCSARCRKVTTALRKAGVL
jgi:hypothetical protein